MSHIAIATRMGFREQSRRPLLLVLLVGLPFFFITRAIASTERIPRALDLPGNGGQILTDMRDIHGANMAVITVGFLAALMGVFVMQAARQADRRLVIAGFRPHEALVPRLLVLASAVTVALVVSLAVTALSFTPRNWAAFAAGTLLIGVIYGLIGTLIGALVGKVGATYSMLFAVMLDVGVVQNPMFGPGEPPDWGVALPGYAPVRVVVDGAFSGSFHAWSELLLGLAWVLGLTAAVIAVLGRIVGRARTPAAR